MSRREIDVEVQGKIELEVRCQDCEGVLEITGDGFSSGGVKIVKVRPCEECLSAEVEARLDYVVDRD